MVTTYVSSYLNPYDFKPRVNPNLTYDRRPGYLPGAAIDIPSIVLGRPIENAGVGMVSVYVDLGLDMDKVW